MSVQENVRPGNCYLGNCPSGKCPFGEFSVRGTVHRVTVHRGNIFGVLPIGEKSFGEKSVREMSVGYCPDTHLVTILGEKKDQLLKKILLVKYHFKWKVCFSKIQRLPTMVTYGVLTFSGSIEMWHWTKMG